MRKTIATLSICLGVILGFVGHFPDGKSHIVFCDVGQGDAILIWEGNHQLLIDAGPDDKALECLEKYIPWWDNQLEVVVATHPDTDHVGGLEPVFRQFAVNYLIMNGDTKQTSVFRRFQTLIQTKEYSPKQLIIGGKGLQFELSLNISIKILSPLVDLSRSPPQNTPFSETQLLDVLPNIEQKDEQQNNRSIVILLTVGQTKSLMMGDIEASGETALMVEGLIPNVNILKVAHHGSKSSTSPSFLSLARPEISVLSLGENNPYGHPSNRVVSDLGVFGSQILRTDQMGDIHLVIDGQQIRLVND
ncbi:MAG: MBL fold metallo-hydrolase [Patescibacteria group bacterium]